MKGDEVTNVNGRFESKYLNDSESVFSALNEVSPSFCLAKWYNVSIHIPTGRTHSCYHPPTHQIPLKEIAIDVSALHNTRYKKNQRKLMLKGERPIECGFCWQIEDSGTQLSDRAYRSKDVYEPGLIEEALTIENPNPRYVEVNFNNACNFKCSYCSPQFSTAWGKEIEMHGAYPTALAHNAPEHFTGRRKPILNREPNPYVEAFWRWWPELYKNLKHFRMTGGEPLLDKNTYRVFDYVLANPKSDLHLNVTSNFSVDEKSWQKYLGYVKELCAGERIEHFMQYVSLDAWGAQAEYIRNGLDFQLLWDRVNQFLTEIPGRNSITFIVTMNNLSVTTIDSLFAGILGLRHIYSTDYQRVWFDTPVLRTPEWQSLQILPESYIDRLEVLWAWMLKQQETEATRFKGFKDYEIARLDRDIAWMREGQRLDPAYINKNKADFYRFFAEHDRRRNTNFVEIFPEMVSWWKECEYHARQS